jgi:hypothetical protein
MRIVTFVLIVICCSPVAIAKTKVVPIEKAYAKELRLVADKTRAQMPCSSANCMLALMACSAAR